MIIRNSFFIRWLLNIGDEQQPEHSIIEIEHIQSGKSGRVSSLEEASQWMQDTKVEFNEDRINE